MLDVDGGADGDLAVSQKGCSARNPAISISRIMSGVEKMGGRCLSWAVSVCFSSTL